MWVFDGEEWIEEGKSETAPKPEDKRREQFDMFYPELQVVEIVPLPQTNYVPVPHP
jgi:hypothetical protein